MRRLSALAVVLVIAAYAFYRAWHRPGGGGRIERYRETIRRRAGQVNLPPAFVEAVVLAESGADPRAVSHAGAKGLMQIMPIAQREVRGRFSLPAGDLFDPDYNVLIGTRYLRLMVDQFDADPWLALAAYNMGPTALARIRRAHPDLSGSEIVARYAPAETRAYCRRILRGKSFRLRVSG